ncbi:MAG: carbon storage regulator CsrA [Desulfobacterales bacterium]|nr:carbon storage regulator CsrA [Desulfobacterales bacterium]MCP4159602.1 carbon storage regulator CsrA [Deltaproteobacteria bacterium]
MLVLTRKVGESINIGDEVTVKVLEVNGANIKIGINAPREISIYRQEVYDRIREENISSVHSSGMDIMQAVNIWQSSINKE